MNRFRKWLPVLIVMAGHYQWATVELHAAEIANSSLASSNFNAATNTGLELRGIIVSSTGPRFDLFDGTTGQSRWVGLNDSHRGYRIAEFRGAENAVRLQSPQRSILLYLNGGLGAESSPVSTMAQVRPQLDFTGASVGLATLPLDQQEKLNDLAMEVRRRQIARANSGNPTGP